jgi:DNA-directed RNA polymerase specialized sigma24 family protein
MAEHKNILHVSMSDKDTMREARLFSALTGYNISVGQLHQTIRSLLMCRTRREREVVAFHIYQSLPINDVAAAMGITPGQVKEHLGSVRQREALAERIRTVEATLRKNIAPPPNSRRRRETVTPPKQAEGK